MYLIRLTDMQSLESKVIEMEGDYNEYQWEEGNYSCDCNRALFLHNKQWPCSEGKISAERVDE